jgi:hypothetical protein
MRRDKTSGRPLGRKGPQGRRGLGRTNRP